jgi:maltokinase
VTERSGETEPGDGAPGSASSSYAADDRLLAELRAAWPPAAPNEDAARGYTTVDLATRLPDAALRIGDRFAVALLTDDDGSFAVVPLARDPIHVTAWRMANAGDGLSAFVAGVPMASERAIEADQTNASVIVGERAIVKWFRRVGPGPSRAATLIAHLDAVGFAEMPAPLGSLTWQSPAGASLTIAQGDAFLPGAVDGWGWCLDRLEAHVGHGEAPCPVGCDPWIGPPLGALTDRLHRALATPSRAIPDPIAVASVADAAGWRAAARDTLDDAVALVSGAPESAAALLLETIGPAMRADLDALRGASPTPVQPVHGDLHVGQVLEWAGGLAVIDFDGNPALDDSANAIRQPRERDLAQMTSSLDHLGRVVDERTGGTHRPTIDAWIARTRAEFLGAMSTAPDAALLAAFEVEQECRELVYAARFLPRWQYAPLATLRARYGVASPARPGERDRMGPSAR